MTLLSLRGASKASDEAIPYYYRRPPLVLFLTKIVTFFKISPKFRLTKPFSAIKKWGQTPGPSRPRKAEGTPSLILPLIKGGDRGG